MHHPRTQVVACLAGVVIVALAGCDSSRTAADPTSTRALAAASAIRAIRDPRAPALAAFGFAATIAAAALLRALP